MSDLSDFLKWRGDLTFEQSPFNKLDAALLAHMSYNIFDDLVSEDFSHQITLEELAKKFKQTEDYEQRKTIGAMINDKTSSVFELTASTQRYKNVKICGYKIILSEEKEEQFAAMTFVIGKLNVISIRGTDDSFIGWKEDFNLAYKDEIASKKDALIYFEEAIKCLKGSFIFTGHSKGAHVAINTAVNCLPRYQKKIEAVFNFDGPGFHDYFYEKTEYKKIENKIYSYYPGCSIVGMIFEHPKNYKIVKSDAVGINQHDPLNWQILGNDFIYEKDFQSESKFFYKAINDWAARMDVELRERFVKAFFGVLDASGCKTNLELQKNLLKSSAKMLQKYSSYDKETKSQIHKCTRVLKQAVIEDLPMLRFFTNQK